MSTDPGPCRCWIMRPLPHEGHCCMTDPTDTCHQDEGMAAYREVQS